MKHVSKLTRNNFDEQVLDGEQPAVVYFHASWCGPCRAFGPLVERLARTHPELRVAKLNVDEAPEIAAQYDVRTVPTLIPFDRGEPRPPVVGRVTYDHLESLLGLSRAYEIGAA